ncbi:hypothetical protein NQ318_007995 [Aromia moschata]|uniref:Sfi1 spindle body domain-containing protein n=1 Tax=Aromia moschata TaxID=1265417 RepID=A0AAV8XJ69_9CUCU|nr:hypothetical protein NQ318_007995 [Aromia moschata]
MAPSRLASRVLLNEEINKITDPLSEVKQLGNNAEPCAKEFKGELSWKDILFWKDLRNSENTPIAIEHCANRVSSGNAFVGHTLQIREYVISEDEPQPSDPKVLTRKYFIIWKDAIHLKKEKIKLLQEKIDKKEKIGSKQKDQNSKTDSEKLSKVGQPKLSANYKNRFIAQKNIINLQKVKLEEQNKIIEELQLGIIREDLLKSLETTKTNIREIFSNCSVKVKCKMPALFTDENKTFMLNTQKAPRIIQHMEQRAIHRAQNRQIILERKRIIEEARQQMLEEAIEKKKVVEEEERKNNLEQIKEKPTDFYNKLLFRKYFQELCSYSKKCKDNNLLARRHYKVKLLQKSIYNWCIFIEEKYSVKYDIADAHFAYNVLKRTINIWHNFIIENVRNMQVAEDVYDFRLVSNTFNHWQRYICAQIILEDKYMKKAERHYKRKILLHYYYQWRSLPAVIQLEKAKELKKQKWREKVWEVLPDYKPPEDV